MISRSFSELFERNGKKGRIRGRGDIMGRKIEVCGQKGEENIRKLFSNWSWNTVKGRREYKEAFFSN